MQSISEFLAMGGYAGFVWPAYLLSISVLTWLVVTSIRGLRSDRRTLEILEQAKPPRRAAAEPTENSTRKTGGDNP